MIAGLLTMMAGVLVAVEGAIEVIVVLAEVVVGTRNAAVVAMGGDGDDMIDPALLLSLPFFSTHFSSVV
jgi:hypothetical protein